MRIALIGKGVTCEHCAATAQNVSAEVISTDFTGMIKEGKALAKLHPQNIEVHGLIPSVENMPGPNAYKTWMIKAIKGLSGKPIRGY